MWAVVEEVECRSGQAAEREQWGAVVAGLADQTGTTLLESCPGHRAAGGGVRRLRYGQSVGEQTFAGKRWRERAPTLARKARDCSRLFESPRAPWSSRTTTTTRERQQQSRFGAESDQTP